MNDNANTPSPIDRRKAVNVGDLFRRQPLQYSTRGDAYLWTRLAERFSTTAAHRARVNDEKMPWELEQDARKSITTWQTWTGEGNPDVWPYPDKHTKSKADGELATRIRYALGQDGGDEPVYLLEHVEHRGTFYTGENFEWLEVECDGRGMKFTADHTGSAFAQLLTWLDNVAPKPHCDTCTCSYNASAPTPDADDSSWLQ